MIRINTADIGPDGLEINGIEDAAFLELDSAGGFPCEISDGVHYLLHASLAGRDLLVTGTARIRIKTQCALCLKEITLDAGSDKICIFREKVPDEIVDITEDVREDILLSIPDRFKCSENCRGLCPGCGADLNEESCRCKKKRKPAAPDHTWDALDDLKF